MILLDASVVGGLMEPTDDQHDAATVLLASDPHARWAMTALTLGEVLVRSARAGGPALVREVAAGLAPIEVVPLTMTADDGLRLAELRALTGLKVPDCTVLLAAEQLGAAVATFDRRMAVAAAEVGLEVRGAARR